MTSSDLHVASSDWAVLTTVALAGAGLAVGSQVLLVAATLPVWYVAAASLRTAPPTDVAITRNVSVESGGQASDHSGNETGGTEPLTGTPGDTVRVRTTVTNQSERPIVDLRVVDAVPDELPVVSDSPETCVSLDAGSSATVDYEVELQRGAFAFGDATVRVLDLAGITSSLWTVDVGGDAKLECVPAAESVPLGSETNDYGGQVPTDEGGSGVEFFSVREYEPGDPVQSIDWRRYAQSRELATVDYRAERSTRVLCLIDARPSQFRTAANSQLPGVSLSADAAMQTFRTLVTAGHPTGVGGLFTEAMNLVAPGTDDVTRQRARDLVAALKDREITSTRTVYNHVTNYADRLHRTLPGETQVYLFTTLVDETPVDVVKQLQSRGYVVHVISPDVIGDGTDDASRLARVGRDNRLDEIRSTGAHVVDWDLDEPLGVVMRAVIGGVTTR